MSAMPLPRFERLLDARGPERGAWPEPERAAALREPFDPAALRAAMQEWQARWREFSERFGEALVPALAAVSPEGRQRIVASRHGPRP